MSENWSKDQKIEEIVITGTKYLSDEEIKNYVDSLIIAKKQSQINLLKLEDKLERYPYIEYCYVNFKNSKSIEISIKERIPIAFIKFENGDLDYIDKFGKVMPNRALNNYSDMPIIVGIEKNNLKSKTIVENLKNLLSSLEDNEFVYNIISEIEYNLKDKSFEFITTDKNLKILFGRLDNLDEKYYKFVLFWKEWVVRNETKYLKHIDLRWKDKVIIL